MSVVYTPPTAGIHDAPAVVVTINERWVSWLLGALEQLTEAADFVMGEFSPTINNSRFWEVNEAAAGQQIERLMLALATGQEIQPVIPSGTILQFAGAAAPDGYLLCHGQAVSRSVYNALFSVIGTAYGAGDGATTFNLPDFRGRSALGAGQGTNLTNRVLGASGGAENVTLSANQIPLHTHPVFDHTHPVEALSNSAPGSTRFLMRSNGTGATANPNTLNGGGGTSTGVTGGGLPHDNMPPHLNVNFIIKL